MYLIVLLVDELDELDETLMVADALDVIDIVVEQLKQMFEVDELEVEIHHDVWMLEVEVEQGQILIVLEPILAWTDQHEQIVYDENDEMHTFAVTITIIVIMVVDDEVDGDIVEVEIDDIEVIDEIDEILICEIDELDDVLLDTNEVNEGIVCVEMDEKVEIELVDEHDEIVFMVTDENEEGEPPVP